MPNKKMLIDASHAEEVRVAVLDSRGQLEELDFETTTKRTLKGNIYLAKITRVEPSLQAAFVEYGGNRHGFLPFNEIHPDYFRIPIDDRKKIEAEIYASAETESEDEFEETPSKAQTARIPEAKVSSAVHPDKAIGSADESNQTEAKTVDETRDISFKKTSHSVTNSELHEDDDAPLKPSISTIEAAESDIETIGGEGTEEFQAKRRKRLSFHDRYKIQEVLQKGQVLLVQVAKEERKAKGAALTTYLSFAGRYCVLMPNSPRAGGVSRKIASPQERRQLKEMLNSFQVPDPMSLIIRTAGRGLNKTEIKRDYDYLIRLWSRIREVTLQSIAPALIYEEASLIKRAIRDLYNKDIDEIWIQGEDSYHMTKQLFKELMPAHERRVKLYDKKDVPLFHKFGIEPQVENLHKPEIPLPAGGSIVFNQTEALVAIDINSGRATRERHIEKTAFNTNMEAAVEIARQLRLRDLAGLIVIDFIDMENAENIKAVENQLKTAMNVDRARIQLGHISPFGLMELSRQRLRPSIIEISSIQCPHCRGTGMMRSMESYAMDLLHTIEGLAIRGHHEIISILAPFEIANYLQNYKRNELTTIEQYHKVRIFLEGDFEMLAPNFELLTGEMTPTARRVTQHKRAEASFTKHKERLQQHKQAPIRGHELEDMTAIPLAPVEEELKGPEQVQILPSDDRGQRRRGRRGGRRRGGPGRPSHPQRATHEAGPSQEGMRPKEEARKSWWQRLLES